MADRKLVFFTSLPEVGGHTTITLGLTALLQDTFGRILVIAKEMPGHGTSQEAVRKLRGQGIHVMILGPRTGWDLPGALMSIVSEGWWKPDAYLAMGMRHLSPVFAAWLMARRSLYYHITHDMQPSTQRMLRLYSKIFTSIGFISPATERCWTAEARPSGATFSAVQPSDIELGTSCATIPDGEMRFGFIGRLNEGKGCASLIQFVRTCDAPCSLRVAGSGEFEHAFGELAGRTRQVSLRFDGAFSPNDREVYLTDFFSSIDYLVVPSQDDREGIPTVILEALAAGVPVIATRTGGMRAFEQPGFGWSGAPCVTLVPPEAVVEAMQALARNTRPDQALRQACRDYYRARFSRHAVKDTWRRVLLDALNTPQTEASLS